MSPKDIAHDAKAKDHQTTHHTHTLVIVAAILFLPGLVVALVGIQSRNINIAANNSSKAVAYTNALALEYAQPYLEANNGIAIEFGDALAMQYAQPWLEADAAAMSTTFSDALALEYAQLWLNTEAANDTTTPYNNSLAFAYAFPWLVPQSAAMTTYSDALAMAYAQPWLNTEAPANCNGRLDEMYACRNGR